MNTKRSLWRAKAHKVQHARAILSHAANCPFNSPNSPSFILISSESSECLGVLRCTLANILKILTIQILVNAKCHHQETSQLIAEYQIHVRNVWFWWFCFFLGWRFAEKFAPPNEGTLGVLNVRLLIYDNLAVHCLNKFDPESTLNVYLFDAG